MKGLRQSEKPNKRDSETRNQSEVRNDSPTCIGSGNI